MANPDKGCVYLDTVLNKRTLTIKQQDITALLFFTAAIGFFYWKAPFGFCFSDESLYISNALRLIMGDSLFADDWHVSQLTGFFLYLPVKAYISVVGSTDGVVLFCRYLFIALQGSVSSVIYVRLRKYGIFSILAALIFFLHIPSFTLMSPGYYALGLAFVVLTGLLMATTEKYRKAQYYLVGLFFACAVLCNPVLAFVFILYSICVLIYETNKNKNNRPFDFSGISFSVKTWFWITLGIFTMASIFVAFLLSRTTIGELNDNFPMLLSDPEYTGSGAQSLFSIQKTMAEILKINPYLFVAMAVLLAVIVFDKKRIAHRKPYIAVALVIFFAYIIAITLSFDFPAYGYWMFPLSMFGITCYLLSENKDKRIFIFIWLLGLLYALCLDITSDMGFIVASQGLLVSDIASVIFIKNIVFEIQSENKNGKQLKINYNQKIKSNTTHQNKVPARVFVFLLTGALFLQICQECYIALNFKFYPEYLALDANSKVSIQRYSKEKLNTCLLVGPEKGLKTTNATAKIYNAIINDLSRIKKKGYGPVLIAGTQPWCYLYLDMPYATFSSRLQADKIDIEKQRLDKYYELHPEKIPRYIYIPKVFDINFIYIPDNMLESIIKKLTENHQFTLNESDVGYLIEILK